MAQQAISDVSVLSWDLSTDPIALLTATVGVGNTRTLPNSIIASGNNGENYQLTFIQDSVGGRTVLFDSNFKVIGEFDEDPDKRTLITVVPQDGEADVVLTPIMDLFGSFLTNIVEDTTPQLGGDLDAQSKNITAINTLELDDITAPAHSPGLLFYDTDDDELAFYDSISGTKLNIGSEMRQKVRNNSGVSIVDFTPVYQTGAIGNRATIGLAKADSESTSMVIGVTTNLITDNTNGSINTSGTINGVDTDGSPYGESWNDGDKIYLSATTAGDLTNIVPTGNNIVICIGHVLVATNNGSFEVKINGADVRGIDSSTDNALVRFDGTSGKRIKESTGINANEISIATGVGSPTIDQVQEYLDNTGSSGFFSGGILSDGGSGTLDVSAGSGFIRTTNDENAELQSFKWSAVVGMAVPDDTTQYVYVDDSGTVSLSTNEFLETPDKIQIGVVTDEGSSIIHTFGLGVRLQESIGAAGRFMRHVHGIQRNNRLGGLIFGQSGDANRDLTMTAGELEWGRTTYPITSFDTSGADTFFTYSASGQEDTAASQWPNEQYDNGGTLTTMSNNKWANLFFWLEPDDHLIMVYGRAQFNTEGEADNEGIPSSSLPSRVSETGFLVSRFTFKKSANTATISSSFEQLFANAAVTDHGDLSGLPDDDHPQYLLEDGTRTLTGNLAVDAFVTVDGRDLSVDGDKLDSIDVLPKNLSWGESYINNWRDLVLDDGATYFPNNGGYEKGRLHQQGIIPSLHFVFGAVKAEVIYALGKNRVNDLDVDRAALATYIDEDRILRTAAFDVARIDYTDGDGAILAEDEGTNLIERSESFGHSYWNKSGATIEGDASTETGANLHTAFANSDWVNHTVNGTGFSADNITGGANDNNYSILTCVIGTIYKIYYDVTATTGASPTRIVLAENSGLTTNIYFDEPLIEGGASRYFVATATAIYFGFKSPGSGTEVSLTVANSVTIKEVSGFSAPDGSTNAFKLIANANNGFIQLASAETISNATNYTNSIFIKRAVGTGNILIKDINNAETNAAALTGVELADNWTRYDITDTSSSTSGQIGVKLATSGDEVYIFGADLKEDLGSSYIKSDSGSSTPRLADVFTNSGDSNTFNSVSGSFKVTIRAFSNDLSIRVISINDGTASNAITIGYNNVSNTILAEYIISGSPVASLTYQVSDITEYHDVEFQYALNDFKLLIDDVERDTDVSGAVLSADTLDSLDYHNGAGSDSFYGKVKQKVILK